MNELGLLLFVGAIGFVIWLMVFSKHGKGGLAAVTSKDPSLPQLNDDAPPMTWGTVVRTLTEGAGTARQTFDILTVKLPRQFPGELIAVPKSWAPNPLPTESVVQLDGVLGEKWFVQAANEAVAKKLLSSPAFRAAVEPLFVKSRTAFIENNTLNIAAKYDPAGDERALWEKSAKDAAAALRAELKAMQPKKKAVA